MIKDKMIELLRRDLMVGYVIVELDFLTINEEVNDFIARIKSVLETLDRDKKLSEIPMRLLIAVAISLIIKDNYAFITPEQTLEEAVNYITSAYVSYIDADTFLILKQREI